MAKIISIASQKGGVGKTTAALNLGFSLSRFGDQVLLLEGDPQGNARAGIVLNLLKIKGWQLPALAAVILKMSLFLKRKPAKASSNRLSMSLPEDFSM